MPDPNIEQLIAVARKVRPLLDELVFIGGCATGLLITDASAPSGRPTFDVDAIAEVTTYSEYVALGDRLRGLGFSEDSSKGAPVCRWISGGQVLDVMPLDPRVLGFSNHWYAEAVRSSNAISLEKSLIIRVVAAPVFLATKLEAFKSRGLGDYLGSHDLEDAVSVIDGRAELLSEIEATQPALRKYLSNEWQTLLRDPRFIDALPGHLPPDPSSQARVGLLMRRIEAIARISDV